jgi:hypothetical protein
VLVKSELRVAIIGPLPPPAGGMAGQTRQLQERLAEEGIAARIVPTTRRIVLRSLRTCGDCAH